MNRGRKLLILIIFLQIIIIILPNISSAFIENSLDKNENIKLITEFYPKLLNKNSQNKSSDRDYLDFLKKNGFKTYEIDEKTKSITLLTPKEVLNKHKAGFTNLLCKR